MATEKLRANHSAGKKRLPKAKLTKKRRKSAKSVRRKRLFQFHLSISASELFPSLTLAVLHPPASKKKSILSPLREESPSNYSCESGQFSVNRSLGWISPLSISFARGKSARYTCSRVIPARLPFLQPICTRERGLGI